MTELIGQLRYTGDACVNYINSSASYNKVQIESGDTQSISFQDVLITPDTVFSKSSDYYLKVKIPQDMNYDMSFNLKLTKIEKNSTVAYQFLKNIQIPRGGSGENVYTVVLYEYGSGLTAKTEAMIPLEYVENATDIIPNKIYYRKSNDSYYLGVNSTTYKKTDKYSEISVVASWKTGDTDNFGIFELVFRPVEDMFTGILLEMVRTAEDYNIQRLGQDGNVEYGRKIDLAKFTYELYSFTNLVDSIARDKVLNRIGVWGHPGLVMVINGEEIKIGPSGYYEQDVLPVTSIGIVAGSNDYSNTWTLDYMYNKEQSTGEGV